MKESIKRKQILKFKGLKLQAGFATYKRWEEIIYKEPYTYRCRWGICSGMKTKKRKIPLPNWHQFYVRYKIKY